MTDEEIKKALECCLLGECMSCPTIRFQDCRIMLKDETISLLNRQQVEIEQFKRNLKQCENGYSQELHLARCKLEELKSLCITEDKLIKDLRAEIERLQKKYDRAMDNLKAVLKERTGEQNV